MIREALERLRASPLGVRLARGAFWTVLNTVVGRAVGLLGSILTARILGKIGYGQLGVVQSSIGMFAILAAVGTSLTATKFTAQFRHTDPARAGRIIQLAALVALVSATLITLLVYLFSPLLAARTLADPAMSGHLRVGVGLLFFGAVGGARSGALAGLEAWRAIAAVDGITGLLTVGLTLGGVWFFGLDGALAGLVVGGAAQCLGYEIALRRIAAQNNIPLAGTSALGPELHLLWAFSLPALLSSASAAVINWLCNAIVVNQPGGYEHMGLFNAANQWRTAVLFLPNTLGSAILPIMSSLVGAGDRRRYSRLLWTGLALNAALAGAAVIVIGVLSGPIMRSYGAGFAGGRPVLILLTAAAWLTALATIVGQTIISSGLMWWGFVLNGAWGCVILTATWVLRHDGAFGFALANLIAYGFHLFTSAYMAWRIPKLAFERAEPA